MSPRLARINRRVLRIAGLFGTYVPELAPETIAEVDRVICVNREDIDEDELRALHVRLIAEAHAIDAKKNHAGASRRPDTKRRRGS